MKHSSVTVLGGGAFGTAFATVLAQNVPKVVIWCREEAVASSINERSFNDVFLPGILLPSNIRATTDLQQALQDASIVFEAIPVKFLRSVLAQAKPYLKNIHAFGVLSKGIEDETLLLPSQIAAGVGIPSDRIFVVSGPNFAKELAQKSYAVAECASINADLAFEIQKMLSTNYFKVHTTHDIEGVQLAGALKNVVALAVGVARGAGITHSNAHVFLIMQGLREIESVLAAAGCSSQTAYGFAGLGDLVLTTMGGLSRNVRAGEFVGQGKSLQEIQESMQAVPESFNTLKSAKELQEKYAQDLPLIAALHDIVFYKSAPSTLFDVLVSQKI
jgi:glycerol-3-phosphate dehydrogenase (NAD(P)+)